MPFAHENLIAYQKAIAFVSWTQSLIESLASTISAKNQLERASTSIPLNIAEGNGKFSSKDRARFWQIAHGSTVECAACLDVLVARKVVTDDRIHEGKQLLEEIVRMLLGLLKRYDSQLVEEDMAPYNLRSILEEDEEVEAEED